MVGLRALGLGLRSRINRSTRHRATTPTGHRRAGAQSELVKAPSADPELARTTRVWPAAAQLTGVNGALCHRRLHEPFPCRQIECGGLCCVGRFSPPRNVNTTLPRDNPGRHPRRRENRRARHRARRTRRWMQSRPDRKWCVTEPPNQVCALRVWAKPPMTETRSRGGQ